MRRSGDGGGPGQSLIDEVGRGGGLTGPLTAAECRCVKALAVTSVSADGRGRAPRSGAISPRPAPGPSTLRRPLSLSRTVPVSMTGDRSRSPFASGHRRRCRRPGPRSRPAARCPSAGAPRRRGSVEAIDRLPGTTSTAPVRSGRSHRTTAANGSAPVASNAVRTPNALMSRSGDNDGREQPGRRFEIAKTRRAPRSTSTGAA
jgi:hypothetical protein